MTKWVKSRIDEWTDWWLSNVVDVVVVQQTLPLNHHFHLSADDAATTLTLTATEYLWPLVHRNNVNLLVSRRGEGKRTVLQLCSSSRRQRCWSSSGDQSVDKTLLPLPPRHLKASNDWKAAAVQRRITCTLWPSPPPLFHAWRGDTSSPNTLSLFPKRSIVPEIGNYYFYY